MKKITLCLLMLLTASFAMAQYKPADQGSILKFTIKNFGFDVGGSFTGFKGNINFDPQNLSTASFDVSIDAATVNTDNNLRDQHLKGEDYFDIKNYPLIRLLAGKVVAAKNGYTLMGVLTIKGKSKEITFPFTTSPSADGLVFKGSFKINRKDFGVGGTSTIANELEVNLNVLAKKS
jgi:polyisoprenoid-binding protein YceI